MSPGVQKSGKIKPSAFLPKDNANSEHKNDYGFEDEYNDNFNGLPLAQKNGLNKKWTAELQMK